MILLQLLSSAVALFFESKLQSGGNITAGEFTRKMWPLFTVEGSLEENKASPHTVFPYTEVQCSNYREKTWIPSANPGGFSRQLPQCKFAIVIVQRHEKRSILVARMEVKEARTFSKDSVSEGKGKNYCTWGKVSEGTSGTKCHMAGNQNHWEGKWEVRDNGGKTK